MLGRRRERKIKRLLIVEDEPLIAFDNEHMLVAAGYEVVATVDCYADAARVIDAAALDLVLSDLSLAGEGTGIDVARAARARGVPVLFVSASHPGEAAQHAIACLAKPYDERALRTALAAVEAKLDGAPLRRVPRGLTVFEPVAG